LNSFPEAPHLATPKRKLLPSVDRTISVLEFIANSKRGCSVSEISRNLALPKSSTFLVLATLVNRGYVKKNAETDKYYFGINLVKLSRKVLANLDLRDIARPFINSLMKKTGLVVHLAILADTEAVLVDRASPRGSFVGADWIGRALDINCSGVGKALVAFLPEDQFNQLIGVKRLAKHNENTIVTIRSLKRELALVREQGYALDDEEDELGLRCIGTPIFDAEHKTVAAVSVAGTTEDIPLERVRALAVILRQTADEISRRVQSVRV
jgi:IclR family transcriptional regulator, KDG regulon repressor